MNMLMQNNTKRMSSQQIADLVGKRHDNVKRTIDMVVASGVIAQPQIEDGIKSSNGVVTKVYVFSGDQGKRDSIVVVAQLSPEFTAALVDRWHELEQAGAPVIALPQDYLSALKALVNSEEQKQVAQKQLAIAQPKADALDMISAVEGAISIREAAKSISVKEHVFVDWCLGNDRPKYDPKPKSSLFLFRNGKGALNAYAHRIHQKFMTQKIELITDNSGRERLVVKVRFTPAGVARVAELMSKERAEANMQEAI